MADDTKATAATGITKLRKMLSWSIDRNLTLERQLGESQEKESRLMLGELAANVVDAVRQTEQAMTLVSEGSRRYAVSELVVSVKGFVDRTDDGLALRLVRAEQKIKPEILSTITLTLARMPSDEPSPGDMLAKALEEAQTAFASWRRDEGANEAHDLTARTTHLVAARDAWRDILPASVKGLAEAIFRFTGSVREAPRQRVSDLKRTAVTLQKTAKGLETTGVSGPALAGLAAAVNTVAARFRDLREGG